MNHVSKIHQRFSDRLRNPRVLTNPQEFLGENYEAILNFWLILDDLSGEQLRVVNERCVAFCRENYSEWNKAVDLNRDASKEVVGFDYAHHAGCAAWDVLISVATGRATRELIGMHKILEDHQQPLTSLIFFPMFIDL